MSSVRRRRARAATGAGRTSRRAGNDRRGACCSDLCGSSDRRVAGTDLAQGDRGASRADLGPSPD